MPAKTLRAVAEAPPHSYRIARHFRHVPYEADNRNPGKCQKFLSRRKFTPARNLVKKQAALEYLENMESRVEEQDVTCINRIREGDPVRGIEEYANHLEPLLVIMATHARGRIGQVVLGSVAEEVMRLSHLPVMMVHTLAHARNVSLAMPFEA